MSSKLVRANQRVLCIGDLRSQVDLLIRSIKGPLDGEVDFTEDFTDSSGVTVAAMIKTATGKTVFDGVQTDVIVTHDIYIRFRDDVTQETWIRHKGILYNIIRVENFEERSRFLHLPCTVTGLETLGAAQA